MLSWLKQTSLTTQGGSYDNQRTYLIYDTLFNNTNFPQFDIEMVGQTECDAKNRWISFEYMGHQYALSVMRIGIADEH